MSEKLDAQFERIKAVFGTDEIPSADEATIQTYFEYLKKNLVCPCLLTGMESMGFFEWEDRFDFGYGSKREYERLKKENGSYQDIYELKEFDATLNEIDIYARVRRVSDRKKFIIPLSELEAVDKASKNYQLLDDYSVWRVNW